jgi:squalene-hopene/tetraprenyl-beta-curcumene cyclase
MLMARFHALAFVAGSILVMTIQPAFCQPAVEEKTGKPADELRQTYRRTVDRAVDYLRAKGRAEDGSYSAEAGPGVTAIATTALLRSGRSPDDPLVAKSLEYLRGFVQPDGGVYQPGSLYRNYETSLAILCFGEADRGGRYKKILADAQRFVKELQWDEPEGHGSDSYSYGGAGYGEHKRPDLSNTSFLLDALNAVGAGGNDEAVQKALVFVSRCQNLETPHNTTRFAAKNPDGGFYYTPAAGGQSMAGTTPDGGLRSYGSMTYAGLKSMIYAGVDKNDPRVKAALEWVGKHYSLDDNPGMGRSGLYYYYHTFAKALAASGLGEITDAKGLRHDWRKDMIEALARRQQPDGSWVNDDKRWLEGVPNLTTAYALLSLSYCRPADEK